MNRSGNLYNLMKILNDNEFTYNCHSNNNYILRYFTSEYNYDLAFRLALGKCFIKGISFNVINYYSTKQIGIMFENENFEKYWIHCPLRVYEEFIEEIFGAVQAREFLDECKERGYVV